MIKSFLRKLLALSLVLLLAVGIAVPTFATEAAGREADVASLPKGDNLFPDPGFETDEVNWMLFTGEDPTYPTENVHSGSRALYMPQGNAVKLLNRMDVEQKVTYELTAWVYGKVQLFAMMHDPAGNMVDYYNAAMPFLQGGEEGKWTQIQGTFMTEDTRVGNISIEFRTVDGECYVDDISFRSCGVIEDTWQPTPSEEPIKLGTYYFGQWTNPEMWSRIKYFEDVDIEPVIGYYNNHLPEVMQWHTQMASDHGISYWVFDWYYDTSNKTVDCSALDEGFLKADNCGDMKFALLWCNEETDTSGWTEENLLYMAQLICDKYLTKDNYLKTPDGQNYFSFTRPDRLIEKFGLEGTKAILKKMDEVAAPYGGFYYVAINPPIESVAKQMKDIGVDALTLYSYSNEGIPQGAEEAPYSSILPVVESMVRKGAKEDILPIIPCASPNWDSRPLAGIGGRGTWRSGSAPELFYEMCQTLRPYADAKLNMMMIGTWNEFGEGSFVEPTVLSGCAYLDAMQKALLPETYTEHELEVPTEKEKAQMNFSDIPPVEIIREDETNLVVNPSFERDYGWTTFQSEQIRYSDDAVDGERSFILTKGQGAIKSTNLIPLEPGAVYNVSVWVKGNGYVTCAVYDETQTWHNEYLDFNGENPRSLVYDEWVQLTGTIDNTDGQYPYVDFTVVNNSEDGADLLVDKVEFRKEGTEVPEPVTESVDSATEATLPGAADESPAAEKFSITGAIVCVVAACIVAALLVFVVLYRRSGKKD